MQNTARTTTPDGDLQYVLDHWDRLDDLLDSNAGTTWPPPRREQPTDSEDTEPHRHAQHLRTVPLGEDRVAYECVHCDYVGDGGDHTARPDRDPAQLGVRPVPIRLGIVDTAVAIETALVACADAIAREVQREPMPMPRPRRAAVVRTRAERVEWEDRARRIEQARADSADPRRWHSTGRRSAVQAGEWLQDRLAGSPGPFQPLTDGHRAHIAIAARETARLLRIAIRDERTQRVLDGMPCPGCKGELMFHQGGGEPDIVSCSAGLTECSARAPWHPDTRRREWDGEGLVELWQRLDRAMGEQRARQVQQAEEERRARRTEARRRQRAAARERAGGAAAA
ncbi:hypothetical protein ACIP9H_40355 [Streptomyces sp. NPDC088732]|uniref:hypothetical protein n=1 Tax=Streptomyces sp. NPDC088732 TaxID=3365879 RepID=UPI003809306F